jgi:hypothetical protein
LVSDVLLESLDVSVFVSLEDDDSDFSDEEELDDDEDFEADRLSVL